MIETITLRGNIVVEVDFSRPTSICEKCGATMHWAITKKNRKWMPIVKNNFGEWASHFADCRYAGDFRKYQKRQERKRKYHGKKEYSRKTFQNSA